MIRFDFLAVDFASFSVCRNLLTRSKNRIRCFLYNFASDRTLINRFQKRNNKWIPHTLQQTQPNCTRSQWKTIQIKVNWKTYTNKNYDQINKKMSNHLDCVFKIQSLNLTTNDLNELKLHFIVSVFFYFVFFKEAIYFSPCIAVIDWMENTSDDEFSFLFSSTHGPPHPFIVLFRSDAYRYWTPSRYAKILIAPCATVWRAASFTCWKVSTVLYLLKNIQYQTWNINDFFLLVYECFSYGH